jgi:hypothetical protein
MLGDEDAAHKAHQQRDNTLSRPRERATADPIRHLPSSWCNNAIHSNFQSAPEYRAVMTGERSSDLLKSSTILNISCTPPKQTRRAIARRSSRSDEGGAKKAVGDCRRSCSANCTDFNDGSHLIERMII